MSASDSPAVAAVRRLADSYRLLAEVDTPLPAGAVDDAAALAAVLAELDEARARLRELETQVPGGFLEALDETGPA